jgi:hypothetical protein
LAFEKNANFFAENCQKSRKIVITTSTPDELAGKKSAKVLPNPYIVKNDRKTFFRGKKEKFYDLQKSAQK